MGPHDIDPFPGPRPFTEAEADLFFGRSAEIDDLANLICTYPLVLLYSQSGAGKSSLIQAGLIPALKEMDCLILATSRVVGSSADSQNNVFLSQVRGAINGELAKESCTLSTAIQKELERRNATNKHHVLIIDQAEELFTAYPERWSERKPFFAELRDALKENESVRILIVMREEYLADIEAFAEFNTYSQKIKYRLERLRREDATEAIVQPLGRVGWHISTQSLARLLDNLQKIRILRRGAVVEAAGEYIEPVHLQVVCRDLWLQRTALSDVDKTLEVPETINHLDASLIQFYGAAVNRAAIHSAVSERKIRSWCERQLVTSRGTRKVLFKGEQNTAGLPNSAIGELEKEYLIRSEPRAGGEVCELTHDRLIGPLQVSNQQWGSAQRRRRIPFIIAVVGCVLAILYLPAKSLGDFIKGRNIKLANDIRRAGDQALLVDRRPFEAAHSYKEALERFRSANDYANMAYVNERLAQICQLKGSETECGPRLQPADLLKTAIDEYRRANMNDQSIDDQLQLAELLFRIGNTEEAQALFVVVLRQVEAPREGEALADNKPLIRAAHANEGLGLILLRKGDSANAQARFLKAMASLSRTGELDEWAHLIIDIGATLFQQGYYRDARLTYAQLMYSSRTRVRNHVEDLVPFLRGYGLAAMFDKSKSSINLFEDAGIKLQHAYNTLEVKDSGVGFAQVTDPERRSKLVPQEQYEQGFNCLALARYRMIDSTKHPANRTEALSKIREAKDIFQFYGDPVNKLLALYLESQILRSKTMETEARIGLSKASVDIDAGYDMPLFVASHYMSAYRQ